MLSHLLFNYPWVRKLIVQNWPTNTISKTSVTIDTRRLQAEWFYCFRAFGNLMKTEARIFKLLRQRRKLVEIIILFEAWNVNLSPTWCLLVCDIREIKHHVLFTTGRQTRNCTTWRSFPFICRLLFITTTRKSVDSRQFYP